MNILLVDDEKSSRSQMADFLRKIGHQVVEKDSGLNALEAFQDGEFQLVLSDNRMPRMSGLQLLNEIRKHPIYSYQMIKDIPVLKQSIKAAVFQHHERLDGSGYPTGERGERIPMEAQIIAVADVFHAMTSERAYRAKEASFKVLEKIKEEEFGKFNLKVTDALLSVVSDLSIGSKVLLSNLEHGEVLYINSNAPTRPLIKLSRTGDMIDLQTLRHIHIQHILR